jgi:sigma-B regulation protein RsbU (phosphoserine phosphatase)
MALYLTANVEGQRQSWALDGQILRVGRSSRSEIPLLDGTVSKDHAEFVREGERWIVRDLGSRNGTRVNGAEVRDAVQVGDGDVIEFGKVEVRVGRAGTPAGTRFSEAPGLGSSMRVGARDLLSRASTRGSEGARLVSLLAEAGQMLVLPRPIQETCEEVLRLVERAVPARRLVILLREAPGAEPVQIAVRHLGVPTQEPLALSRTILSAVLDDCISIVTRDAAQDPRFQAQQSVVAQAIHSAMAVPLFDNEKVLGALYADTTDPRVQYGDEHLEVFTVLGNMAAVKITNARLLDLEATRQRMAQELATAAQIQRSLLPEPPTVDGVTCVARLETCYEVGGDLYDLHVRPDGRLVVVVGDVSGKGMGAALLMSSTLSSARVLYDDCHDPAELVTRLNAVLHRSTDAGRFVTLFVGCLDPASGALHYCNAGHDAPVIVGAGGLRRLDATGIPVGVLGAYPYAAAIATLAPGETLALYSDGIPEALRGQEFFGEERLADTLRMAAATPTLDEAVRSVLADVETFAAGTPRADDITLVLVRRT